MRIVDIRDTVVPIKSDIRNSYIDFSQMTVSVLALVTDMVRDGKPMIGYGFNSNGRYAPSGLLRDRFLPRLKAAPPESLLDETGENLDPHRIWAVVMRNEKPGGHGERSVAVGVLDMAVWDAVAKIAGLPLYRLLATATAEDVSTPKFSSTPPVAITIRTKISPPCRTKCAATSPWATPS